MLYHGPRNDLPKEYSPKDVAAMLNAEKDRILCVQGNCDAAVDQMVLEFPIMASYALLYLGKRTVFATHGDVFNTAAPPPLAPATSFFTATRTCRPGNPSATAIYT